MNFIIKLILIEICLVCGNEHSKFNSLLKLPNSNISLDTKQQIKDIFLNQSEPVYLFEYYSNENLSEFMHLMHNKYSKLTKLYTIGSSVEGRKLTVLALSANINQERPICKPIIKFIANQHGDEVLGRQLLIYFVQYLLVNYNQTQYVSQTLNTLEIHILFSMNPDGFQQAKQGNCNDTFAKLNSNCIDLNKDFPNQFQFDKLILNDMIKANATIENLLKNELSSLYHQRETRILNVHEPEVEAVIEWIHSKPFLLSISFYSSKLSINYPTNLQINNQMVKSKKNIFQFLSSSYANDHHLMKKPNLRTDQTNLNLNSSSSFVKMTSMQDYNYFAASCYEIAVHLSTCNYPDKKNLKIEWSLNKFPMINYLKNAHLGIKGVIYDDQTNLPLENVYIFVEDNQHRTKSNYRGEYWRLLLNGEYNITFVHSKYNSQTFRIYILNDYKNAFRLDVRLRSKSFINSIEKFSISKTEINEIDGKPISFNFPTQNLKLDFQTSIKFKYHNFNEMQNFLIFYHKKYKNITNLYSIGKSIGKHDLLVLEITKNPGFHQLLKPEFKYTASIHGNEAIGKEMLLLFIKMLLENYGRNDEITKLINTTRIHIMPCFNVDGSEMFWLNKKKNDSIGQNNSNNQDLDRDFPDRFDNKHKESIEQETLLMMTWLDEYQFVLSGSFFSGELVVVYPYNSFIFGNETRGSLTPDNTFFQNIAKIYSKNHPKMKFGERCYSSDHIKKNVLKNFKSGIVNGAEFNLKKGSLQDYNYQLAFCFEVSIYLGCERYPSENELSQIWLDNRLSMLRFVQQVHSGVKGVLRRSTDNHILRDVDILIQVQGNAKDICVNSLGDYFRLLNPGKYNISISLEGFYKKTKQVKIYPGKVSILNFTLTPKQKRIKINKLPKVLFNCSQLNLSETKQTNCTNCGLKSFKFELTFKYMVWFVLVIGVLTVILYTHHTIDQTFNFRRGFNKILHGFSDEEEPIINLNYELQMQ